jgi:NADPH2:quinone reductase
VRELAPGGVAAVFDHAAGPGLKRSWAVLGRGGILIVYGNASTVDDTGWRLAPLVSTFGRLIWWSLPPNGGRRGRFYSINHKNRFDEDLAKVVDLLRTGELQPHVAIRLPLAEAPKALRMLNDRAVVGKIVLEP